MGKVTGMAKIAGVMMVVLTTVAVRFWLYAANKQRARGAKVRFTVNERYFLDESFPYYKHLSAGNRTRLEERAGILLAELVFDRYDRKEVTKDECVTFAMTLSLLTADQPYHDCREKIVVFRGKYEPEITFQAGKPVLFVDETALRAALSGLRSTDLRPHLPANTAEILVQLYMLPAVTEKK